MRRRAELGEALAGSEPGALEEFRRTLEAAVTRTIERVRVTPLSGDPVDLVDLPGLAEAAKYVRAVENPQTYSQFVVEIIYDNGDRVPPDLPFTHPATAEEAIELLDACG